MKPIVFVVIVLCCLVLGYAIFRSPATDGTSNSVKPKAGDITGEMPIYDAQDVKLTLDFGSDGVAQEKMQVPAGQPFVLSGTFRLAANPDKLSPLLLKIIKHKRNGGEVIYQSTIARPEKTGEGTYEVTFDVGDVVDAGNYELRLVSKPNETYGFGYNVYSGDFEVTKN